MTDKLRVLHPMKQPVGYPLHPSSRWKIRASKNSPSHSSGLAITLWLCNALNTNGMTENDMQGEDKERWKVLAEQAAVEQDPEKLLALVKEIEELLAKKQDRLPPRK